MGADVPFRHAGDDAVLFPIRIAGHARELTFALDSGSAASYLDEDVARCDHRSRRRRRRRSVSRGAPAGSSPDVVPDAMLAKPYAVEHLFEVLDRVMRAPR